MSTGDTHHDLKRLHVIFAVSTLSLLLATLWMVAVDWRRDWRVYQQKFRDEIDPWITTAVDRQHGLDTMPDRNVAPNRNIAEPEASPRRRTLAIEQVALNDLPVRFGATSVTRFDRCTSCHQGIDRRTLEKGSELTAARQRTLILATPDKRPDNAGSIDPREGLARTYGLWIAPRGILQPKPVTVQAVTPRSLAAIAGFSLGDVIVSVDCQPITSITDVATMLLDKTSWGETPKCEVQRGLPHPWAAHPKPDLFCGPTSPHPAKDFGCTVCHEGQGSATAFLLASHSPNDLDQRSNWHRSYGWTGNRDWLYPMRPRRFAESNCLRCHHDVTDLEPSPRFRDPPAPKLTAGYHLVQRCGCFGCHEIKGIGGRGERIGPDMRLEPGSSTSRANPGTMQKVGPSLRGIAGKLEAAVIMAWIADPVDCRPATQMPRFFGMHEHLDPPERETTQRFDHVEVRAIAEYLLTFCQNVLPPTPSAILTEVPSADRGKQLFRNQGCLACHQHSDFPQGQSTQGPDLSRIGAKLRTPAGQKWLTSWIRDPWYYSPHTLMPNCMLQPFALEGEPELEYRTGPTATRPTGSPTRKSRLCDPAADIAAFLMASAGWAPPAIPPLVDADLDELALLYLSKTFPRQVAAEYIRDGVPKSMADKSWGDATELFGPITREKKLRFVGRQTIRKRGCFGCHDIVGFEDTQGIGPVLSDWGRKPESQLAFEEIAGFLATSDAKPGSAGRLAVVGGVSAADEAFYREALISKRREGFIWQKLHDPRSFDYLKASRKGYNEHLLMGRFSFTEAQREAIITFMLGLVAEPPKETCVYHPDRRTKAIIEGRKVLDKYGCAQCHTLEMERWTIDIDPKKFAPPPVADYPFVKPQVTAEQCAASMLPDRRGLTRLDLVGMPQWNAEGKPEETEDEDGNPLAAFVLWEPCVISGNVWPVGGASVLVSQRQVVGKWPALGGDFARLLYPASIAQAKAAGSASTVVEAWGWGPPALVHEGESVQPNWLYNFLCNPMVIRPAAVLRMPKFNLSAGEAGKLVDYFAAVAGVEFPYTTTLDSGHSQATGESPASTRHEQALRLIVDRTTYCAKCHLIGDYHPGGQTSTVLAPNLEDVGNRIRPEYLRRWLANPRSVLPYTAMPINFPLNQSMGQNLFKGTSQEQLDAVMELLLDYDQYMKQRTSVQKLMKGN